MDHKPVFVDTWGWMALGHRREPHHIEVKRIYQALRSSKVPLYTSDYVLDKLICGKSAYAVNPYGDSVAIRSR